MEFSTTTTTTSLKKKKELKSNQIPKKKSLYKTEFCRTAEEEGLGLGLTTGNFNEFKQGSCPYGEKCQFAHSKEELRSLDRHPRYKTEMCKTYWEKGSCPYGKRCVFIHSQEPMDESMSLHQPRQRQLSQQVVLNENNQKHKRIQSAREQILEEGVTANYGNGAGNVNYDNNRTSAMAIPTTSTSNESRHFRSLSNSTSSKKPSLSVATSFQLAKSSLDFSITAPAYGVNSIPSARAPSGVGLGLQSALPAVDSLVDGQGPKSATANSLGFHLNFTSQTPTAVASAGPTAQGFNPLAPGFTPSGSFSTPPGFNSPTTAAPQSPFPTAGPTAGSNPVSQTFNQQSYSTGSNLQSHSFQGQSQFGFYPSPRKNTKPLSIAIVPGSPLRGQSLSALPKDSRDKDFGDEMWGPLSAFPGGSSGFPSTSVGSNGSGFPTPNGSTISGFSSAAQNSNSNSMGRSLEKSFEKMSIRPGSVPTTNGFNSGFSTGISGISLPSTSSMPPGFKSGKHHFESQPSPLATTFEFGSAIDEATFDPPSSPVFRSLNRKRVNEVWQKQMFTPSTSPASSPGREKKGLEEFVESLISPPNSP